MATCCDRTHAEVDRLVGEFADLMRAIHRTTVTDQRAAIMATYAELQAERRTLKPKGGYTHGKRKKG
jgi:hypothetical protein